MELPGPDWLRAERRQAAERFEASGLPSSEQEVWRYSRIDELELDRYRPADAPGDEAEGAADLGIDDPAAEVIVVNGHPVSSSIAVPGVGLRDASGDAEPAPGAAVEPSDDAFVDLNLGFAPHPIEIEIAPGTTVEAPIVVRHTITGTDVLAAPQLTVHAGRGSQVVVIEVFESDAGTTALSVPLARLQVDQGAHLTFLTVQQLGQATWQIANQNLEHRAGRHARRRLRCSVATTPGCAATAASTAAAPPATCSPPTSARATRPRLPHLPGPPGARHHVQPLVQGRRRRPLPIRLHRAHPGAEGGAGHERLPDQPQPQAVRARVGRVGAEPRDREQRRALQPRLDGRSDRRRAALLPREPRRAAGRRPSGSWSPASSPRCSAQMPVPALREHVRREIAAKLDRAADEGAIARG